MKLRGPIRRYLLTAGLVVAAVGIPLAAPSPAGAASLQVTICIDNGGVIRPQGYVRIDATNATRYETCRDGRWVRTTCPLESVAKIKVLADGRRVAYCSYLP